MNRLVWNLRYGDPEGGGEDEMGRPMAGPLVLPRTYTVRLSAGGKSYSQALRVVMDPRSGATAAELQKQFELSMGIWRDMGRAGEVLREGGRGAEAERVVAGVRTVNALLATGLGVVQSADRTPTNAAYEIARQGKAELEGLLAEWKKNKQH
jgi:hypothetical protein